MTVDDRPASDAVPWRLLAVLGALLVLTAPVLWGFFRFGYGPIDSVLALTAVDDDATAYAAGYDEQRFHDLLMGTDVADLVASLGQPFSRFRQEGGETHWHYSKRAGSPGRNFHARIVVVSELGKVTGSLSEIREG